MNSDLKAFCARSDPRMNRALVARLRDPHLSLFHCLCIGGFDFNKDEASELDSDIVTLAQRKNQLNRRLRSYRQRNIPEKPSCENLSKKQTPATNQVVPMPAASGVGSQGRRSINQGIRDTDTAGADQSKMTLASTLLDEVKSAAQTTTLDVSSGLGNSWVSFSSGAVPPFSQQQPIAPDGESMGLQSIFSSTGPGGGAQRVHLRGQPCLQEEPRGAASNSRLSIDTIPNALDVHPVAADGGPVPSLPGVRNTDLLVLPNMLSPTPQGLLFSQIGTGAGPMSAFHPSRQMGVALGDPRQELALRLFQQDVQGLYASCMSRAGFLPEERQPASPTYRTFVSTASEQESRRRQAQNEMSSNPERLHPSSLIGHHPWHPW